MLFPQLLRWESKKGLSFKSFRERVAGRFLAFHLSHVYSFCCKAGPGKVEVSKPFPTRLGSNNIRICALYEEPSRNVAMDVERVDQANHTSHPYGIQTSAKTALQPGITHTKADLRSCSTEGLLTRDMAKATLWLFEFGHQQSGFTEWRESCPSRRAFISSHSWLHIFLLLL